jgi:hypothetical protein
VDLTLAEESIVQGQVTSSLSGTPLESGLVRFRASEEDPGKTVFIGEEGAFYVAGLAAGTYEMQVQVPGYPRYKRSGVIVSASDTTPATAVEISGEGRVLSGTVRDALSGLPLPGAMISFQLDGMDAGAATADNAGSYRSDPLAQGIYEVEVAFGASLAQETVAVEAGARSLSKDLVVSLSPSMGFTVSPQPASKGLPQKTFLIHDNRVLAESGSLIEWDGIIPYVKWEGILDTFPEDYKDYSSQHPLMNRDPRISQVLSEIGHPAQMLVDTSNTHPHCTPYAAELMDQIQKSEQAYKEAWKAIINHRVTLWAGRGEIGSRVLVASGKAAELFLVWKKLALTAARSGAAALRDISSSARFAQHYDVETLEAIRKAIANVKDFYTQGINFYAACGGGAKGWRGAGKFAWFSARKAAEWGLSHRICGVIWACLMRVCWMDTTVGN